MNPEFLDREDVLVLHDQQIQQYGGAEGVRHLDLLDSAVAQARATYGGEFLHANLFAMATAYLFHIIQNHAFVDGNKRTGLAAALVFLDLNGHPIEVPSLTLYELCEGVATGGVGKIEVENLLRQLASPSRENLPSTDEG